MKTSPQDSVQNLPLDSRNYSGHVNPEMMTSHLSCGLPKRQDVISVTRQAGIRHINEVDIAIAERSATVIAFKASEEVGAPAETPG